MMALETESEVTQDSRQPASARSPKNDAVNTVYRVFWRWHFYAGVIATPVILSLAITGGLYVFKDEIEPLLFHWFLVVSPSESAATYQEQIEAVRQALAAEGLGQAKLSRIILSKHANRSTLINASVKHEDHTDRYEVFVDPTTAKVLHLRESNSGLFRIILSIHRNLMAGTPGRVLIELVTCWTVVLLATGLYLWWPKGKQGLWGVWLPRLFAKPYVVLRDLHAVPAAYGWILLVLVTLTGLFFSVVWGTGYLLIGKTMGQFDPQVFAPPEVQPLQGGAAWDVDQVMARVLPLSDSHGVSLELPPDDSKGYSAVVFDHAAVSESKLIKVDPYQQEVTVLPFSEAPPMFQARVVALTLHMGTIGGLPTKILAFLVCMLLIAGSITGLSMWWKRRPQGTWGLPRGRLTLPVPWPLLGMVALLGLLMPVFGLSLLLILAGEWVVNWIMTG